MSENTNEYGDRAVVEPSMVPGDPLPATALIGFIHHDVRALLEAIGRPDAEAQSFSAAASVYRVDDGTVVVGPTVGAPAAVIVQEMLIARGVERILCLGSCGSLQRGIVIGDLILPDSALSDEGTSDHYLHPDALPIASGAVIRSLEQSLEERGLRAHRGPVWTTDAPFRETVDAVTRFSQQGILAVEMEMSALFTVGMYREVDVGALLFVSDELATLEWVQAFRSDEVRDARKTAAEVIVSAL
jgi:uridine phosphorylase